MNKELILKYKKEFEHNLHGDLILVKYANPSQAPEGYEDWHEDDEVWEGNADYLVVINDEYVEFRRALAEGKTIQSQVNHFYGGYSHPSNINEVKEQNWKDDTSGKFVGYPFLYRIKPEEPKFKVGDKVTVTYNSDSWEDIITSIDDNLYYFESGVRLSIKRQNEQIKPIKFKVGDWVRDRINGNIVQLTEHFHPGGIEPWQPKQGEWCFDKVNGFVQVVHIYDNKIECRSYQDYQNNSGYTPIDCYNLEPFIGELPTSLKGN